MQTPKMFFMIRHGETVANAAGYAAGSLDSPLTERGRAQAVMAQKAFVQLPVMPDYIVHSHLSRAKDTASIINGKANLPVYECRDLAEQCFGDWQGMSWPEMRGLMQAGQNPPHGETMVDFYKRAMKGIQTSLSVASGMPLIVTHGGVFDAFWNRYGLENIVVQNCALYRFTPLKRGSAMFWDIHCDSH